jgi:hypothetical protein
MLSKLIVRTKLAIKAFSTPVCSHFEILPGVVFDIENKRIIITGDFSLHTEGNLRLSSDKHVIIKSGQSEEERTGYVHGIWLNSIEDSEGKPLLADDKHVEDIDDGSFEHAKH